MGKPELARSVLLRDLMTNAALIVGEAPSQAGLGSGEWALYPEPSTSTGGRLCRLADMDTDHYLAAFRRMNAFSGWKRYYPPADFVAAGARVAAEVVRSFAGVVVLLGSRCERACGVWENTRLRWRQVRHLGGQDLGRAVAVASIPHPSGLNRLYSSPVIRAEARTILRQAAGLEPLAVAVPLESLPDRKRGRHATRPHLGPSDVRSLLRVLRSYGFVVDGQLARTGTGTYHARVLDRETREPRGERWLRWTGQRWLLDRENVRP